MHSAEPFDRRPVNPPSQPPPASEAWRAELASRVHNYRTRHKGASGQESLALDFDPATDSNTDSAIGNSTLAESARGESQLDGAANHVAHEAALGAAHEAVPASLEASASEVHPAFDTNYYRRLNAQALEQVAPPRTNASAKACTAITATATALAEPEWGADYEANYDADSDEDRDAARLAPGETEAKKGLAIDLKLHEPASGDACLERYCIQGVEPNSDWEAGNADASADSAAISAEVSVAEATVAEATPVATAPQAAPALPQGNLIVFPRPTLEPPLLPLPSRDELAEPVHRRPRILEVPEDIMPAVQGSLFPEIRLDGDEPEVYGSREPEIEVSLRVAPVAVRLTAGLADLMVVLAAGGIFAVIAEHALPDVPHAKPFWMGLGVVTVLFWAVYQHLFLLYAGRTIGMSMNGIHLSTFDGRTPRWSERRRRAVFTIISFVSVALGFLWALVDEDTLCWHDRVSRTFPTTD